VARTARALDYARAADFVVSASGYNSFHELLYHKVPTIFMPQMAPVMDDQQRRAHAAADRGLARIVLAHEMLRLGNTIRAFLDGDNGADLRAALIAATLPETGNAQAARLIEEVEG
jgi:UDP:flavonoid glycosyltransferase YjiC (YdhE family)